MDEVSSLLERLKKLCDKFCYCRSLWLKLSYFWFYFLRFMRDKVSYYRRVALHWLRDTFPSVAYLFSKSDVLLSIHPISRFHKSALTYHYPPPGYGLPPGYIPRDGKSKEYNKTIKQLKNTHAYGLHIWPARLWRIQWFYMILVFSVILLPLAHNSPSLNFIFQHLEILKEFVTSHYISILVITIMLFVIYPRIFFAFRHLLTPIKTLINISIFLYKNKKDPKIILKSFTFIAFMFVLCCLIYKYNQYR